MDRRVGAWLVAGVVTVALPDLPDRARAWTLGDTPDAGRLAALATALGLDGRPVGEAGGWTLRDGRRGLMARRLAGVPWTYEATLLPLPWPGGPVAPARPARRPALPGRQQAALRGQAPGPAGRHRDRRPARPPAHPRPGKRERPADQAWLLPAYLFDLEGGWTDTRPVLAVPERYLTR